MNKVTNALFFIAGTAVGAIGMYKYAETKAYQKAQEEINEMKKYYKDKYEGNDSEKVVKDKEKPEQDENSLGEDLKVSNYEDYEEVDEKEKANYKNTLTKLGYDKPERTDYGSYSEKPPLNELVSKYKSDRIEEEVPMREDDAPYIIEDEEDFGNGGYETIVLEVYMYDEVLVSSDNDEPVEDVDGAVGVNNLKHFIQSEDNSIYIRNDARQVDFEIIKVDESYAASHGIR